MDRTIQYYNENADAFANDTINTDMTQLYSIFQKYCKPGSKILDFGCGSGRDTKFFLEHGYKVNAIDGSEKLCEIASAYTGIKIKHMCFNELNAIEEYDGIWACSSILHVSKENLPDILKRLCKALVIGGHIYTSFKYGDFHGDRNGRFFTDFTEESFLSMLTTVDGLQLIESTITSDVRTERQYEKWLNLIIKRVK